MTENRPEAGISHAIQSTQSTKTPLRMSLQTPAGPSATRAETAERRAERAGVCGLILSGVLVLCVLWMAWEIPASLFRKELLPPRVTEAEELESELRKVVIHGKAIQLGMSLQDVVFYLGHPPEIRQGGGSTWFSVYYEDGWNCYMLFFKKTALAKGEKQPDYYLHSRLFFIAVDGGP